MSCPCNQGCACNSCRCGAGTAAAAITSGFCSCANNGVEAVFTACRCNKKSCCCCCENGG